MMSSFDPKLEHLLTNFFMALGDQHDIRQALIQNQITSFDLFTSSCTLQFPRNMQLQKGTDSVDALKQGKIEVSKRGTTLLSISVCKSGIYQEKLIAQFSNKSRSTGPVTKNHQLRTDGRTVYKL